MIPACAGCGQMVEACECAFHAEEARRDLDDAERAAAYKQARDGDAEFAAHMARRPPTIDRSDWAHMRPDRGEHR